MMRRSSEVENALARQRCSVRQSQVICWFHWSLAFASLNRHPGFLLHAALMISHLPGIGNKFGL